MTLYLASPYNCNTLLPPPHHHAQAGLVLCLIGITLHVVMKALHPPKPPPHTPLSPIDSHQKVPLLSDTDGEEHELFSR